jgi:hypothetical protein
MGGFAHRPGDVASGTAVLDSPGGYDEGSVKRIEAELCHLGAQIGDVRGSIAYLEGALDEGVPNELLQRIGHRIEEARADMSRLMCEAKKVMRGE